jgi:hypothetical protein
VGVMQSSRAASPSLRLSDDPCEPTDPSDPSEPPRALSPTRETHGYIRTAHAGVLAPETAHAVTGFS